MSAGDPAEAIRVFNLLLKFFGNGERWVKGRLSDRRGNFCLVGALDFVSSHYVIKADAAERYFADENFRCGGWQWSYRGLCKFPGGTSPRHGWGMAADQ